MVEDAGQPLPRPGDPAEHQCCVQTCKAWTEMLDGALQTLAPLNPSPWADPYWILPQRTPLSPSFYQTLTSWAGTTQNPLLACLVSTRKLEEFPHGLDSGVGDVLSRSEIRALGRRGALSKGPQGLESPSQCPCHPQALGSESTVTALSAGRRGGRQE